MSRIGKKPVQIPSGVKVQADAAKIQVQGPKGKLEMATPDHVKISIAGDQVTIARDGDARTERALHGLTRSMIRNMILGVTEGFTKELEIVGVGFKAQVKGKILNLALGFTHPIDYNIPEGVEVKCPNPTRVVLTGADKQRVGQAAAEIRGFFEPEPYKGKGISYVGETIRRKQGKTVG